MSSKKKKTLGFFKIEAESSVYSASFVVAEKDCERELVKIRENFVRLVAKLRRYEYTKKVGKKEVSERNLVKWALDNSSSEPIPKLKVTITAL